MVAGLSRKKKSQAAHIEPLIEASSECHAASSFLAEAIDRDATSFESVMAAYKLPQGTPDEQQRREEAIQQALKGAAEVPLQVARKSVELFEKLGQLEPISSPSMLSDIRVGRLMAAAAVRGSLENVTINLEPIVDPAFVNRMKSEVQVLSSRLTENPVSAAKS
jgi:formiminotetrahydrofolate cyclodeaminase